MIPYWIQDLDAPKCWRFCFDLDAGKSKPTENRHCRVGGKSHQGAALFPLHSTQWALTGVGPQQVWAQRDLGLELTPRQPEGILMLMDSWKSWLKHDLYRCSGKWGLSPSLAMKPKLILAYSWRSTEEMLTLGSHTKGKVIPLPHPFAANTILCITENNTFVH